MKNIENKRRCSKCKEWKDKLEFYKNKTRDDGLAYWCKICMLTQQNDYKQRPEYKQKRRECKQRHNQKPEGFFRLCDVITNEKENIDYVRCKICKIVCRGVLSSSHLRTHHMTYDDYKERFPDAVTTTKKFSERLSMQSNNLFADPIWKTKRDKALAEVLKNPEVQEKKSKKMKAYYANPEWKAKTNKAKIEGQRKPIARLNHSISATKMWKNPIIRENIDKGQLNAIKTWNFMKAKFRSKEERDVAKIRFEQLGIVPICEANWQFPIIGLSATNRVDFYQLGFFHEHHPPESRFNFKSNPDYQTIEVYEYSRRTHLNENGYVDYEMILTQTVAEARKLYKFLGKHLPENRVVFMTEHNNGKYQ